VAPLSVSAVNSLLFTLSFVSTPSPVGSPCSLSDITFSISMALTERESSYLLDEFLRMTSKSASSEITRMILIGSSSLSLSLAYQDFAELS
jgi:hypothetical protein